jgi:type 1 glutamine amidotransferase
MRSRRASIALIFFVAACGGSRPSPLGPSGPGESDTGRARVLMITTTAAFRHDSIPTAVASMRSLAASNAFTVTATEDLSLLAEATLASYDVVMFALTSGELALSAGQRTALVNFVAGGHGFIGVHSATDTLYEWPEYGRLVGAYFRDHPWTQRADVVVEDQAHPSTSGLGGRFSILEEFYTFRDNPRGRVQVLLRLDPSSVGSAGDYPLAWAQSFGAGRSYYNALGHFPETWTDQRFLQQLAGAIRWAAGR